MKISNLHRRYANVKLIEASSLDISEDYHHYLKNVLRLKIGDHFRIFNGTDGEFIAQITSIGKHNLSVSLVSILRKPILEANITLAISIIKNDKMLDALNMAVQLGVTKIIPLIAERSQYRNINEQKLLKSIIESTEQSERLTPPILAPLTLLATFLEDNIDNMILYANEHEDENNTLSTILPLDHIITVIVGPEGGFSPSELKMLSAKSNTRSISLGKNVLRTETAVAACLAQINLLRANRRRIE